MYCQVRGDLYPPPSDVQLGVHKKLGKDPSEAASASMTDRRQRAASITAEWTHWCNAPLSTYNVLSHK